MPRKKKTETATKSAVYTHRGIPQVGDAALYGDNPKAYYTTQFVPVSAVGPGDIVDDIDPNKRYTFYLFEPTTNEADAARELDRLRRGGWFKCEAPRFNAETQKYESNGNARFISATGKFETRDGVLVLGRGIWYALPYSQKVANRKAAREASGPNAVADAHAGLQHAMRSEGLDARAEVSGGELGQRR